jgi:hypothetical protein
MHSPRASAESSRRSRQRSDQRLASRVGAHITLQHAATFALHKQHHRTCSKQGGDNLTAMLAASVRCVQQCRKALLHKPSCQLCCTHTTDYIPAGSRALSRALQFECCCRSTSTAGSMPARALGYKTITRTRTTRAPSRAAIISGVWPSLSGSSTFAPAPIRA